jgi:hypothetical protein
VVANSLQDDLLGIPGVEGAEVDGSQGTPAGLRIKIAEGADQAAVGSSIRSVLSSHGLGTDTMLPGEDVVDSQIEREQRAVALLTTDADSEEDDSARTVIDLTDSADAERSTDATRERSIRETLEPYEASVVPESWEPESLPSFVEPRKPSVDPLEDVDSDSDTDIVDATSTPDNHGTEPRRGSIARIESVAVVEGRSGIQVTVGSSDGQQITKSASSTEGGVEAAVVMAAANLVDASAPDPVVIDIEDRRIEGVDIIMIVLDADGQIVTGSAVVAAGRAFALGRATWAALAV